MTKSPNPSSENAIDANGPRAEAIILDGYSGDEIRAVMALEGSAFVEACYGLLLGRLSDYGGLRHHVSVLEKGESKESVLRGMYGSEEARSYRRRHRPISFVDISTSEPSPMVAASPVGDAQVSASLRAREVMGGRGDVWIDMTTAFQWTGGVVGIVRAELEMAVGLKKVDPNVRFSMQVGDGFAEIPASELSWLLMSENVADAYMNFFARYKDSQSAPGVINVSLDTSNASRSPFKNGDTVFACGWMDSQKEIHFTRVRKRIKIFLCYLVYDTILLNIETRHFYRPPGYERFFGYLKWISHNCDFLLFGGETAKADYTRVSLENGWPQLPGRAVKFGSDLAKSVDEKSIPGLVSGLNVQPPFILVVGSVEPRKNHETLYRAYLLALERTGGDLPQLVFAGKPMGRIDDLVELLRRDPRIQGRLLLVTPTDMELAALYKSCMFTILASVYEGWSLTLPESFGYGKFCLASDVPPLREVGGPYADYVSPYDVSAWADAIIRYSRAPDLIREKEAALREHRPQVTWTDTARMVSHALQDLKNVVVAESRNARPIEPVQTEPTIWMDFTLSYLYWSGGVTGIVRSELNIAYNLKKIAPNSKLFVYDDGKFWVVDDQFLLWMRDADDLTLAYQGFQEFWRPHEAAGTGYRSPKFHQHQEDFEITEFPENSIVFFAAIDSDGTGEQRRVKDILSLTTGRDHVTVVQLIYDLTPVLFPHFHLESTCKGYVPFVDFVQRHFNHIVYGGRTAEKDGIARAEQSGSTHPSSDWIEFGSDIMASGQRIVSAEGDAEVLTRLGVTGPFVMTVGTIEPRKNHQVLYKAFLAMSGEGLAREPIQMLFIGKNGWKTDDLIETIASDDRVKGRILLLNPTDEELDVLYRNCLFTLLPSFYEGWSLTLPESLSYGKFCLVSDVAPLREVGRDLVEYIHPLDNALWAKRIAHYVNAPQELAEKEARIATEWRATTWRDTTQRLIDLLLAAHVARGDAMRPGERRTA